MQTRLPFLDGARARVERDAMVVQVKECKREWEGKGVPFQRKYSTWGCH